MGVAKRTAALTRANQELHQEISERKRAEEALQENVAALRNALEEIQILKDQLYKENLALREEIDVNRMFEEIVGSSPALQVVLSRVAKVAPTDVRAAYSRPLVHRRGAGETRRQPTVRIRPAELR